MEKKQKTMLAVLAALVLGMGGIWFFVLGGSDAKQVATGPAPTRKVKVRDDASKKKTARKTRERKATQTVQRRERDLSDRDQDNKRKKKRRKGPTEKKKKIQPAA